MKIPEPHMTVQELIDELNKIEDKDTPIHVILEDDSICSIEFVYKESTILFYGKPFYSFAR